MTAKDNCPVCGSYLVPGQDHIIRTAHSYEELKAQVERLKAALRDFDAQDLWKIPESGCYDFHLDDLEPETQAVVLQLRVRNPTAKAGGLRGAECQPAN